jgi:hypothetical protein
VSAAGHLDATDAAFGELTIDSLGVYVTAPAVTYGLPTAGYKFKLGAYIAAGMSCVYDTTAASMAIDNNVNATGDGYRFAISTSMVLRNFASGAGKTSGLTLAAYHGATSTNVALANDGTNRTIKMYGTLLTYNGSTIWHAANDGASSGLDADLLDGQHGNYYAPITNPTFPGYVLLAAVAPTIPTGGAVLYMTSGNRFVVAYNDGTNIKYRWLNLAGTDASWNYQLNGTPPA